MKSCAIAVLGKDHQIHLAQVQATSLFDAARAIAIWMRNPEQGERDSGMMPNSIPGDSEQDSGAKPNGFSVDPGTVFGLPGMISTG